MYSFLSKRSSVFTARWLLMMAYPLELAAQVFGLWSFNNYLVTPFGLITGLAWGLFTMPILHGWQGAKTSLTQL